MAPSKLLRTTPFLWVADLHATNDYYVNSLGYEKPWLYGEPPTDGGVTRSGVEMLFSAKPPAQVAQLAGFQVMIFVDEPVALYEEYQASGARIISPLTAQPWAITEFVVQDLNGYHLRFDNFTPEG